jgi:ribosomal protein S18 acetylase RimI-like enzyme
MKELSLIPWDDEQKLSFFGSQFSARQAQYRDSYPHAEVSIILKDEVPVGVMTVDRKDREIRLVDIAILPEHQNAGIGTVVMSELISAAEAAALPITLHVLMTSPAVRFYERLGFSIADNDGAYLGMVRE